MSKKNEIGIKWWFWSGLNHPSTHIKYAESGETKTWHMSLISDIFGDPIAMIVRRNLTFMSQG